MDAKESEMKSWTPKDTEEERERVWKHLGSSWFTAELFIVNLHINGPLSVSYSLFFYISLLHKYIDVDF